MFIDEVKILVKAGDGGNGCVAFRREKFVARGGPSGGDGGKGGDIVIESNPHMNTLLHLRYTPQFEAERGRHGEGSNRHGRDGKSSLIEVPVGTLIFDLESGENLFDFQEPGQRFSVALGGRGGRGNARFTTSTRQAPRFSTPGREGRKLRLRLVLKLLADVGLVGFPNVGKSTLISRLSAARPKIADYPFTTLEPQLGVVALDVERSFVMADIPGLIEGAHEGHGLGTRFLRHIERTRLLLHLVDVSEPSEGDVEKNFQIVARELSRFSPKVAEKPVIVVASKVDAVSGSDRLTSLRKFCFDTQRNLFEISSQTGQGLKELKEAIWKKLQEISRASQPAEEENATLPPAEPKSPQEVASTKR